MIIASMIVALAIIVAAFIVQPTTYRIAAQGNRPAFFRMNARTGATQYCGPSVNGWHCIDVP